MKSLNQFEVDIKVNSSDIRQFYYRFYGLNPRNIILISSLTLIGAIALVIMIIYKEVWPYFIFTLPLSAVLGLPRYFTKKAKRIHNENPEEFNAKIIANDDELVIEKSYGKSNQSWKSFFKVIVSKETIFIFPNKRMAHIIPKRCFKSTEECNKFILFVKTKINKKNLA